MSQAREQVEQAQRESEDTRGVPLPGRAWGERRGRSVVHSLRLPREEFAEIERIAAAADIPIGALLRGWVLAALQTERDQQGSLPAALESEAYRLHQLARRITEDPTHTPERL